MICRWCGFEIGKDRPVIRNARTGVFHRECYALWYAEERALNIGLRGGQGRSAADVHAAGISALWCVVGCVLIVGVVILAHVLGWW